MEPWRAFHRCPSILPPPATSPRVFVACVPDERPQAQATFNLVAGVGGDASRSNRGRTTVLTFLPSGPMTSTLRSSAMITHLHGERTRTTPFFGPGTSAADEQQTYSCPRPGSSGSEQCDSCHPCGRPCDPRKMHDRGSRKRRGPGRGGCSAWEVTFPAKRDAHNAGTPRHNWCRKRRPASKVAASSRVLARACGLQR